MKTSVFALFAVFASTLGAYSAHATGPAVPANSDYPWLADNYMNTEGLKAKERAKRKIASGSTASESMMSPQLIQFRDKFLAIKKAEEIDPLLTELDKNYDQYPADLKFVAARLIPFRHMKSIVWRLKPAVEKPKIAHSMLLTMVQNAAARMRVYFPTEQWEAQFAYVTEPFEGGPAQFKNVEEFQIALGSQLYPDMLKAARRIEALDFSKTPAVFDNKLGYGTASFQDDIDRFMLINEAERHATLMHMHVGLAELATFCAYNRNDVLQYTKDLGELYGIDALFWDVDGAPQVKRVKALKKYKNLFTLTEYGREWMKLSFKHLRHAVQKEHLVWEELRGRGADDMAAINPAKIIPWSREVEMHLKNVEAMLKGETEVRSRITGEVVRVNLPAYYLNPPTDLKALAPVKFDTTPEILSKGKLHYRNYFRGRAVEWNTEAYKPFLPGLTSGTEVANQIRVLRQSWGTFMARFPFSRFAY